LKAKPSLERVSLRQRLSSGEVEWSPDFERIKSLPRRPRPEEHEVAELVAALTVRLKRPGGTQTLRDVQALTLWEGALHQGVIGMLRTGAGKCVDAETEIFDVGAGRRRKVCELGEFITYAKNDDGKLVLAKATTFESGVKLCVRLSLKNGATVTLSTDHPVLTQRGWVQAAALQPVDVIAAPRSMVVGSELVWEHFGRLEDMGHRLVYDVSVPGPQNFVGNGIVLHNTLLGMLLPMLMPDCKRALLLLPPDLRPQFAADWEVYGKHWVLPNLAGGRYFVPGRPVLHVVAYSGLSGTKNSNLLDQIQPDLVMADECSSLRSFETSRVRRFNRCFADYPNTRFCGWDASAVANSIENFWHLLAMALGMGSPVPVTHAEVRKWGRALDPEDERVGYWMPGVLQQFCEPGESVRSGFQRRLISTPGIIVTEENVLTLPLIFQERKPPPMPAELKKHLSTLRRKSDDGGWKRPDGEELRTPVEVAACAKQLAQGCWLYWRFPRGEPTEVIDDWFARRQEWNRELRAVLQNSQVHMDSPKLCENAAERWFNGGCTGCARGPREQHQSGCREALSHPLWAANTYLPWRAVEDTVHHVTACKWESDWLLEDAAAWAREAPGIVWVDHPDFGRRLEQMTGFRYYGGGDESALALLELEADGTSGQRSIICSVAANKKGKNLQAWSRCLIVSFPSSNDTVEQAVGRVYREGQLASSVVCNYYLHTQELEHSFSLAKARARFIWETMGQAQKLVYAQFLEAA